MTRRTLIILAIISLLAPTANAWPRHRDPSTLGASDPSPVHLYELYGELFTSIDSGNYSQAEELLDWLSLVYAPPGKKDALERYHSVIREEIEYLNLSDAYRSRASERLTWLDTGEAQEALAMAAYYTSLANQTRITLDEAGAWLSETLGTDPDRLNEMQLSVSDVINLDQKRSTALQLDLDSLLEAYRTKQLTRTQITLHIDQTEAYVGEQLHVWGRLSTLEDAPLPGRTVTVHLNSRNETAETGIDGSYSLNMALPYIYTGEAELVSVYWPQGEDAEQYAPNASRRVNLVALYDQPILNIDEPPALHPAKPATLTGTIQYDGKGVPDLPVEVELLGVTAQTLSDESGGFTVTIHTPEDANDGAYYARVYSEPLNRWGPAEKTFTVSVKRMPMSLNLRVTRVVFSGVDVRLSGSAFTGGDPLSGCSVTAAYAAGAYTNTTAMDGGFTLRFKAPGAGLIKSIPFTVTASPSEPWIKDASLRTSMIIVNPASFSLLLVAAIYAAKQAFSHRRRIEQPRQMPEKQPEPVSEPVQPEPVPVDVLSSYWASLSIIRRVTGESQGRSQTLREYLSHVKAGLLEPVYKLFSSLTALYERLTYGPPAVEPEESTRIYDEIKEATEADS